MPIPEFLTMHCTNTDDPNRCPTCPRDFAIPVGAVEGIYKDKSNRAIFLIREIHYCPHPECSDKLRFIESSVTYDEAISIVDGKIDNIGDIKMVSSDIIGKG